MPTYSDSVCIVNELCSGIRQGVILNIKLRDAEIYSDICRVGVDGIIWLIFSRPCSLHESVISTSNFVSA